MTEPVANPHNWPMLGLHPMELRHLRYFQAVAETLSFSQAAAKLRVAQPAVSRQVKALEQELGVALFNRTTTQVRLTEAGRYLLTEVDRLLAQLAIAMTGVQEIGRGNVGRLNLGSDWRVLTPGLTDLVRRYRSEHEKVELNFVEMPMHEQIPALRDGRIHLAFVHWGALNDQAGIESMALYATRIKLAVPNDHPLAQRETVRMQELRDMSWIRPDERKHPGAKAFIIQLCHAALFTPRFARTVPSIDSMLAHVALGDGVCVLPTSLILRDYQGVTFVDTDCPLFEFAAAWLAGAPMATRDDFIKLLRERAVSN